MVEDLQGRGLIVRHGRTGEIVSSIRVVRTAIDYSTSCDHTLASQLNLSRSRSFRLAWAWG